LSRYPELKEKISVYIFGSTARGESPASSDVDFFFAVDNRDLDIDRNEIYKIYDEILKMAQEAGIEKSKNQYVYFLEPEQNQINAPEIQNEKMEISFNRFENNRVNLSLENFDGPTPFIDRALISGNDILADHLRPNKEKMKLYFLKNLEDLFEKLSKNYEPGKSRIKSILQRPINFIAWSNRLGLSQVDLEKEIKSIAFIRQYFSVQVESGDILRQGKYDQFLANASPALIAEFDQVFEGGIRKFDDLLVSIKKMQMKLKEIILSISKNWLKNFQGTKIATDALLTYFVKNIEGLKKLYPQFSVSHEDLINKYLNLILDEDVEKFINLEKSIVDLKNVPKNFRDQANQLFKSWFNVSAKFDLSEKLKYFSLIDALPRSINKANIVSFYVKLILEGERQFVVNFEKELEDYFKKSKGQSGQTVIDILGKNLKINFSSSIPKIKKAPVVLEEVKIVPQEIQDLIDLNEKYYQEGNLEKARTALTEIQRKGFIIKREKNKVVVFRQIEK
jgi:hypothetical protein